MPNLRPPWAPNGELDPRHHPGRRPPRSRFVDVSLVRSVRRSFQASRRLVGRAFVRGMGSLRLLDSRCPDFARPPIVLGPSRRVDSHAKSVRPASRLKSRSARLRPALPDQAGGEGRRMIRASSVDGCDFDGLIPFVVLEVQVVGGRPHHGDRSAVNLERTTTR